MSLKSFIHFNVVNIAFYYQTNDKYEYLGVTFASPFIREKVYIKFKNGVEKERLRQDLCNFIISKDPEARGDAWKSRMNDYFEEFCYELICKGESFLLD